VATMLDQDVKARRIITETKGNNDARFNKPSRRLCYQLTT
jgi:hypothetical protein